jgi:hypothetical protein
VSLFQRALGYRSGLSVWGSLLISPVGLGGFDEVGGEDLGGFEFDDGDGGFVGDREDSFAGSSDMGGSWLSGGGGGAANSLGERFSHLAPETRLRSNSRNTNIAHSFCGSCA